MAAGEDAERTQLRAHGREEAGHSGLCVGTFSDGVILSPRLKGRKLERVLGWAAGLLCSSENGLDATELCT